MKHESEKQAMNLKEQRMILINPELIHRFGIGFMFGTAGAEQKKAAGDLINMIMAGPAASFKYALMQAQAELNTVKDARGLMAGFHLGLCLALGSDDADLQKVLRKHFASDGTPLKPDCSTDNKEIDELISNVVKLVPRKDEKK